LLSTVREIYARLLREGEALGVRREASTTPLEHVAALAGALEPIDAITELTAAYVQVRYGETEPDAAETAELRRQFDALRPIGDVG
jgi:hypothetical protein